jgi:hypothetical protein
MWLNNTIQEHDTGCIAYESGVVKCGVRLHDIAHVRSLYGASRVY